MARFSLNPPGQEKLTFAVLRVLAALTGTVCVVVAVLYSGYLSYTELAAPQIEAPVQPVSVSDTGREITAGRSSLKRRGRLWQMHLEGSPLEIGTAHGQLTGRLFRSLDGQITPFIQRRFGASVEAWSAAMALRWNYRDANRYLSAENRRELAALALALPPGQDVELEPYHRLLLYQCFTELSHRLEDTVVHGTVFAGHAKSELGGQPGNLIIGRSLSVDLYPTFEPDRIVAFHYPDGKYPFVSVGWAGMMGVVTGINARGVFVGLNAARTQDPVAEGPPLPLLLRQILEDADTMDAAVELLAASEIRTSGLVLIADGTARQAVVVEVSPQDRSDTLTRGEDEDTVWATDHMLRDAFEGDGRNQMVRRASSGYRYDRLTELLESGTPPLSPTRAAQILRDRRGHGDSDLGLGNRNVIDTLHGTHAVVIDATSMVLWVAEGPSAIGRFRAFDLRYLLGRQGTRPAPLEDIPAAPLLASEEYRDYLEALAAVEHARYVLNNGAAEQARTSAMIALALAPELGDLHRLLGDIERELGNIEAAIPHYQRYLELIPGRERDRVQVEGILNELGA